MKAHGRAGWIVAMAVALAACGGEKEQTQEAAGSDMGATAQAETQQAAQTPQQLPEGVTPEMIAQGKQIYSGPGLCATCHGPEGKGVPNLGADLTDDEWLHIDGSYQGIIDNIQTGVSAEKSTSGTPMPPKGGSAITEEQVKAVAAYVWSLSHGG